MATAVLKNSLLLLLLACTGITWSQKKSDQLKAELFTEDYLIERPLLAAMRPQPGGAPILLIDELDRTDEPFEAFLLEALSDFQVTIPELGTIRAPEPPIVILTSNRTREVHDALKRRCLYHWVDYPTAADELAIIRRKVKGCNEQLSRPQRPRVDRHARRGPALRHAPARGRHRRIRFNEVGYQITGVKSAPDGIDLDGTMAVELEGMTQSTQQFAAADGIGQVIVAAIFGVEQQQRAAIVEGFDFALIQRSSLLEAVAITLEQLGQARARQAAQLLLGTQLDRQLDALQGAVAKLANRLQRRLIHPWGGGTRDERRRSEPRLQGFGRLRRASGRSRARTARRHFRSDRHLRRKLL